MSRLAEHLQNAWLGRSWLACALWPLSRLMAAIVCLRRLAFHRGWARSERLLAPVVVVGNRIVGGAGKTPTTIALLQHLQALGWKPGVLSRGYKAEKVGNANPADHQPVMIDEHTASHLGASATGDEPMLIWRRTHAPVMVGPDRAASGRALLAAHPEINLLVCDDGLQHLKLQRDIEIIVFDERGAGNGWLLPAGPLREPLDAPSPPGLRAPPIVIYNAGKPSTGLSGHLSQRLIQPLCLLDDWWRVGAVAPDNAKSQASVHARTPPLTPATLAGRDVWAVAAIATPKRFFDALRRQGFAVRGIALGDHADFATLPWPPEAADVIVTEKDAVKLRPDRIAAERPGCRVWVAALDFQPEPSFWSAVDAALAALAGPAPGAIASARPTSTDARN